MVRKPLPSHQESCIGPRNRYAASLRPETVTILQHDWGRDKMDAISQTTFSIAFSWMKMYEYRMIFHLSLFLRVKLTIFQHWFRKWLGADQATSHYLQKGWLAYWCIYASLGLNELRIAEVYTKFSGRLSEEPFPWLIQKFPCILIFKIGQPGCQPNLSEGQIWLDLTSGQPLV